VLCLGPLLCDAATPTPQKQQQQQQQQRGQTSGTPAPAPAKPEALKAMVRTFSRPENECPPLGLAELYQWDDGKGNDLTLEIICTEGSPDYFSMRLSQSLNRHYTPVATPGGDHGVRTGPC